MDSFIEKTYRAIDEATQGMTAAELAWHPKGKWSAAQVLEHLSLTYVGTAKVARRLAASENPEPFVRSMKNRLATFIVITLGYFPSGRKSPEMVVPGNGVAAPTVLENLRTMDEALAECERRHGPGVTAAHPVIGPLTLPEWRKFHWVHARHHMKQIAALREAAGRRA